MLIGPINNSYSLIVPLFSHHLSLYKRSKKKKSQQKNISNNNNTMFLRANLISVKPNAFVGALQQGTVGSQKSIAPRLCSSSMDSKQTPTETSPDAMSTSFGEGYATRSNDEGFGGIYSDTQQLNKEEDPKEINENSPEFDKSQGSDVKEKEKGRNQHNDGACN